MNEKPWVKTYAGGKPNYCTPEVPCKTDPRAPHGFDRNASHSADRYVCECESWEPVDNVYMSEKRVHKTDKSIHEPVAWAHIENNEIIEFETDKEECEECEYCVPLYAVPPKRDNSSWVGLTPTEFNSIKDTATTIGYAITKTEVMLKEKNT